MSTPTYPNYINGEWVEGDTFENRNPANTDDLVGNFVKGTEDDVNRAADAAQEAFAEWSSLNAPARGKYLYKVADILEAKLDQLAEDMTREEGKTLPEAKGETMRSINIFRFYGGEGSRMPGFQVPSERPRVHMFAVRRALGVVGLVNPWNFPSAIPAWKLAPALICGNTVILKPASAAPLCSWRLVEACHEAGIPKGVVNYIAGSGGKIGNALVDAKPLKAISFTGSCEVGAMLHERASKRRLKIQLEMGGKNPTIVLADCNLDEAVANVVNAAFFSTGQKCTATSRCIVEEPIYEQFIKAMVAATKKLRVGNGLEAGVHIGPAIDEAQLLTNLRYIEIGKKEAGDPVVGGNQLTGGDYDKGYFCEPTIFRDVTSEMTIAQEEVFGPVLGIMKATGFDDAMKIANDVPFGLSASVQTSNVSRVFDFIYGMEAGLLTVNLPSAGVEYQLPFGGTKDSSFGPKEQGLTALDFYSDYKTVYLKY